MNIFLNSLVTRTDFNFFTITPHEQKMKFLTNIDGFKKRQNIFKNQLQ